MFKTRIVQKAKEEEAVASDSVATPKKSWTDMLRKRIFNLSKSSPSKHSLKTVVPREKGASDTPDAICHKCKHHVFEHKAVVGTRHRSISLTSQTEDVSHMQRLLANGQVDLSPHVRQFLFKKIKDTLAKTSSKLVHQLAFSPSDIKVSVGKVKPKQPAKLEVSGTLKKPQSDLGKRLAKFSRRVAAKFKTRTIRKIVKPSVGKAATTNKVNNEEANRVNLKHSYNTRLRTNFLKASSNLAQQRKQTQMTNKVNIAKKVSFGTSKNIKH